MIKNEVGKVNIKIIILLILIIILVMAGTIIAVNIITNKDYDIEDVKEYNYFKLYQDEKYGVINKNAEVIIDAEYEQVYIPNPSKEVFICYYNYNSQVGEYEIKVLNSKNEELFTEYERVEPFVFKESVSSIPFEKSVLKYKQNDKYGIIDFEGKQITKPIYDSIDSLLYKEGCLIVEQEGKYGVINIKGKEIVDIEYDFIKADGYYSENTKYKNEGFILSKRTDDGYRYGYISAKGKMLLDLEYGEINRITEIEDDKNIYLLAVKNGRAAVLKNKKIILDYEYEDIEYNKTNKLFCVQKSSKQGVYDLSGEEILPIEYDYILFSGKNINAKLEDEVFIFNSEGQKEEGVYTSKIETNNENYIVTVDEQYNFGVVNKEGQSIISNNYQYIEYAFSNYFIVTNNGKVGILDEKENIKVPFEYDIIQKVKGTNLLQAIKSKKNTTIIFNNESEEVVNMENATIYVEDNFVKVISNTQRKYTDKNGNLIESKEISKYPEMYSMEKDGKWGFEGQVTIDAKYDMVTELNEYGYAGIKKDGMWGVINKDGEVIVEPTYEISWQEPEFIGPYCKLNFGYGFEYYTNQI